MSLMKISNVELFRCGIHNGDDYSREDLMAMVDAFDKVGYQVPVKFGHEEIAGMPAYGWVTSVRVQGDVLVGDMEVQSFVYDQIKDRLYDHVSVEIYFNAIRDGVTYPRALKAVALLGAETPGCAGLKPLREATFAAGEFQKVASFNVKVKKMDETEIKKMKEEMAKQAQSIAAMQDDLAKAKAKAEAAEAQRDALLKNFSEIEAKQKSNEISALINSCKIPALRKNFSVIAHKVFESSKVKCMAVGENEEKEYDAKKCLSDIISQLNEFAKNLGMEVSESGQPEEEDPEEDPGMKVHNLTTKMVEEKKIPYHVAMKQVLAADEKLRKAYVARKFN